MQIILTQDVDNLGKAGELVSVRPGYGRNYLVPRGLAVSATVRNKNRLDHEKSLIERKVAKERAGATEIATRINGMTLQFERMVGEDEKLFGSVTNRDIAEQLKKAGVEIDHRWIHARPAGQGARQVRGAGPPRGGRHRDPEVLGRRQRQVASSLARERRSIASDASRRRRFSISAPRELDQTGADRV